MGKNDRDPEDRDDQRWCSNCYSFTNPVNFETRNSEYCCLCGGKLDETEDD